MPDCPECGAPDTACELRFNEFLALEFENAEYGNVHHLTVSTFMLQHSSKLTREGWLYERELIREFLIENNPPSYIREKYKDLVDNGKRSFKIKSKNGRMVIGLTRWTKTILDVRTKDAATYTADVKDWARSSLFDSEAVELK